MEPTWLAWYVSSWLTEYENGWEVLA